MENATLGFLYREYVMQKFDYDYCYVLKTLISLDPNSINHEDSFGHTPLTYLLNRKPHYMPVIRKAVEVILFENPDLRPDVCAERSPMILALALDKSMAKREIEDKIPVLKGGFVVDASKYGFFGHHSAHGFCLNFFVPLLMESGRSVSKAGIFLLVDLRDFVFTSRVGGTKKNK